MSQNIINYLHISFICMYRLLHVIYCMSFIACHLLHVSFIICMYRLFMYRLFMYHLLHISFIICIFACII